MMESACTHTDMREEGVGSKGNVLQQLLITAVVV